MLHLLYLLPCQCPVQASFLQPPSISSNPSLSCSNLTLSLAAVQSLVRHLHSFCTSTLVAEAIYQPDASCGHSRAEKHTWTLSNTTLCIWMKTHASKHRATSTINNDRQCLPLYAHMHTLIYLINTLLCYTFSSEALRCMCVYINANVCVCVCARACVCVVTLKKRHCGSTEG